MTVRGCYIDIVADRMLDLLGTANCQNNVGCNHACWSAFIDYVCPYWMCTETYIVNSISVQIGPVKPAFYMNFKLIDFHLHCFSKSAYIGKLTKVAIIRLWDRIDLSKRPLTEFTVTKSSNQVTCFFSSQNYPLNDELNPICHFQALLGAHHILHVFRIMVKFRLFSKSQKNIMQYK